MRGGICTAKEHRFGACMGLSKKRQKLSCTGANYLTE